MKTRCPAPFFESAAETYASVFAQMFPKKTTLSDIYSDAQLDRLCGAITAKLEKAVPNGVETVH